MLANRLVRVAVATAALVVPLGLPALTAPATAMDVVHFTGTGTISPGLPAGGCADQNVTFSSTFAVAAGLHAGVYSFTYGGGELCSTLQSSRGAGAFFGDVRSNNVRYVRTGQDLALSADVVLGAGAAVPLYVHCAFTPTSVNPVSSYSMPCTGATIRPSISCPPLCATVTR